MLIFLMTIAWLVVIGVIVSYVIKSSGSGPGQNRAQQEPWQPTTPPRQLITFDGGGVFAIFGGFFLGRWRRRAGKLVERAEPSEPCPIPDLDPIAGNLLRWRITPYSPPTPAWPKWQPLWPRLPVTKNFVEDADLIDLWVPFSADPPSPPYERLQQAPSFPAPPESPPDYPCPPVPALLPLEYPEPQLILPLWGPDKHFWLLNRFVEAAHGGLVRNYRAAVRRHEQRKEDAAKTNQARIDSWREASKRREATITAAQAQYEALRGHWTDAKRQFEAARDADLLPLRTVESLLAAQDPEGIRQHFDLALRWRPLPLFVPTDRTIAFQAETGVLLVEQQFPGAARMGILKDVSSQRTKSWRAVTKSERRQWIAMLYPSLLLRIARTLAEADTMNVVKGIAVNGWVDFHDRATGHPRRAYCACVFAKKADLLALKFESLDPVECLRRLHGRDAGETYEVVPVMPVLRLGEDDARFIESKAVLGHLQEGQNLAAMPWEDFEHFIREVFELVFAEEGATVKVTRASRDHGVDGVIFNRDPVKGGKTLIQAKRYTNVVELSAVRDLFGAVSEEHASRGILVTTSYFGPEAYAWAQDLNLSLIVGPMLLGLLEKHGLHYRIDLAEAKALMEQSSL